MHGKCKMIKVQPRLSEEIILYSTYFKTITNMHANMSITQGHTALYEPWCVSAVTRQALSNPARPPY